MARSKQQSMEMTDARNTAKPGQAEKGELTASDLDNVAGGDFTTIQWTYTKQDDTGAASGTVATNTK